ncbi:MAG: DUF4296 domain-containing protein [Chitinophagales bacterium]
MKKYFIISFLMMLQVSCSDKASYAPSGMISKSKMVDIFVDVHLAEAAADNRALTASQINSLMALRYDSLFRKNKTTFREFKASYDYYAAHPAEIADIYDEVVNKLTTLESRVSGGKPARFPKQLGDSLPHSSE